MASSSLPPNRIAEQLVRPAPAKWDCAQRCLNELQTMVRCLGPEWSVFPFGSYSNGFATAASDLDVSCFRSGHGTLEYTAQQAAFVLSSQLVPMISKHGDFWIKRSIMEARIPILKLCFEGRLDVDLSCQNVKPILNTRLLKAYSSIDPRISALGLAVKYWATCLNLADASKSKLSSYGFTLMVVYFLQTHPDVQLPVLPAEMTYTLREDQQLEQIMFAKANFRCNLSVCGLMFKFLEFYSGEGSNCFVWNYEVVSIRLGKRSYADSGHFERLRDRSVFRLHIEDPYELHRDLTCTLDQYEESKLYAAFRQALNEMLTNQTPVASPAICHDSGTTVSRLPTIAEGDESQTASPTAFVTSDKEFEPHGTLKVRDMARWSTHCRSSQHVSDERIPREELASTLDGAEDTCQAIAKSEFVDSIDLQSEHQETDIENGCRAKADHSTSADGYGQPSHSHHEYIIDDKFLAAGIAVGVVGFVFGPLAMALMATKVLAAASPTTASSGVPFIAVLGSLVSEPDSTEGVDHIEVGDEGVCAPGQHPSLYFGGDHGASFL